MLQATCERPFCKSGDLFNPGAPCDDIVCCAICADPVAAEDDDGDDGLLASIWGSVTNTVSNLAAGLKTLLKQVGAVGGPVHHT